MQSNFGKVNWSIFEEDEVLHMTFKTEPKPEEITIEQFREQLNYQKGNFSYLSCNRIGARDVYEKNLISTQEIGINGEYVLDFLRRRKNIPVSNEICKYEELITLSNQVNGWLNYIFDEVEQENPNCIIEAFERNGMLLSFFHDAYKEEYITISKNGDEYRVCNAYVKEQMLKLKIIQRKQS